MSRHERRKAAVEFRREARRELVTHCIAIDAVLDAYPLLDAARSRWVSEIPTRKPRCSSCRRGFADDVAVAATLIVTAPRSTLVGIAGYCCICCTDEALQHAAVRTLRRILPNGKFE